MKGCMNIKKGSQINLLFVIFIFVFVFSPWQVFASGNFINQPKIYWPLSKNQIKGITLKTPGAIHVSDQVTPNYEYRMALIPNDTYFSSQWYLNKTSAPSLWDTTTGDSDLVVAVLDTGVDINHQDLSDNIWINKDEVAGNGLDDDGNGFVDDVNGWDFITNSSDPLPKFDGNWTAAGVHHGTAIAGVIGAMTNNGQGIAGLNWRVSIMPIRVLNGAGSGDTASVVQGIKYAMNNGANYINLSFVGDNQDDALDDIIAQATQKGIVVVAAAGNEGINLNKNPRYPVCSPNVVGVGGVDQSDELITLSNGSGTTGGSNFGSNCIDLVAPANNFISTVFYDPVHNLTAQYLGGWSGTSLAAPLVTGSLALLKSHFISLSGAEIVQVLKDTADSVDAVNPTYVGQLGSGRINLYAAYARASPQAASILTAAGPGGGPHLRILSSSGVRQTQFYSENQNYRNGLKVSAGDTDGDGVQEVIVAHMTGDEPIIKIFNKFGVIRSQFYAYNSTFKGGVTVASGDINGDGVDEIITGAGPGGGPHVRIFDRQGNVVGQFFAYAKTLRSGITVASGDINGDGVDEIITGAGPGGGPHVRIFDRQGNVVGQFFAYAKDFRGGVAVSVIK